MSASVLNADCVTCCWVYVCLTNILELLSVALSHVISQFAWVDCVDFITKIEGDSLPHSE